VRTWIINGAAEMMLLNARRRKMFVRVLFLCLLGAPLIGCGASASEKTPAAGQTFQYYTGGTTVEVSKGKKTITEQPRSSGRGTFVELAKIKQISPGMTEEQVRAICGNPQGQYPNYRPDAAQTWNYFTKEGAWVVGFNKQGKVLFSKKY
jgi:hypothetical protein